MKWTLPFGLLLLLPSSSSATSLTPGLAEDNSKIAEVQMIRHEGLETRPYRDINGNLVVGVGHNITARGMPSWVPRRYYLTHEREKIKVIIYPLSRETVLRLLREDMASTDAELLTWLPWTATLDPVRFSAMRHLAYTLGIGGLMKFVRTLEAAEGGDWTLAARRIKASQWAKQVGRGRTRDVTRMLVTGQWPGADLILKEVGYE